MRHLSLLVAALVLSMAVFPPITLSAQTATGSDGKIAFGYRVDAAPFSSVVDGELAGYSVELCFQVAEHLIDVYGKESIDADLIEVEADDRFDLLRDGAFDVLCGASTVNLERRATMSFSLPIYEDGIAFAVGSGASQALRDLADQAVTVEDLQKAPALQTRKLGYLKGTTTRPFLEDENILFETSSRISGYKDHRSAMVALEAGEIDAYFASSAILNSLVATEGFAANVSTGRFTHEPIALALEFGNANLAYEIDRKLSELYLSGEILEIFEAHFGPAQDDVRAFFERTALR